MTEEVIVMATARSEKESLESILEREVDVRKTRWKVWNGLIEKMSGNWTEGSEKTVLHVEIVEMSVRWKVFDVHFFSTQKPKLSLESTREIWDTIALGYYTSEEVRGKESPRTIEGVRAREGSRDSSRTSAVSRLQFGTKIYRI